MQNTLQYAWSEHQPHWPIEQAMAALRLTVRLLAIDFAAIEKTGLNIDPRVVRLSITLRVTNYE